MGFAGQVRPAGREATEEAHRLPRGKRQPETEIININESIFLSKTPETLDLWNLNYILIF